MTKAYLLTNAGLYFLFAVMCTLRHTQTAKGIGYTELNASGQSEYLVIYGGLQFGLALIYFFVARDAQLNRAAIAGSVLLYGPIVVYRLITLGIFRPTSVITQGTAALEVALLLWGLIIWKRG